MKTLLIAFTLRSGSNFLCEQLRVNGIGLPAEYFQHPFGITNKAYYDEMGIDSGDFKRFINNLPTHYSQNGIFATKLTWDHKNVLMHFAKPIRPEIKDVSDLFPDSKWLFIRRRDKVSQAISLWIAQRTGFWIKKHTEKDNRTDVEYQFFEILDCLMHILVEDYLWEKYFFTKNTQPLVLYYEDFEKDPRKAVLDIAHYIDVAKDLNLYDVGNVRFSQEIVKQRTDFSHKIYDQFVEDLTHLGIEQYWLDRSRDIDRWKGFRAYSEKSPPIVSERTPTIILNVSRDHIPIIDELRSCGASVGEGVFIGPDVYIERDFAPLLTIEDGVVISKGVTILLHDSALNNVVGEPVKFAPVRLRRNCYIGANATILCGVEVGERAIVGAESLVNRDIPPDTYAYGHPARVRGTIQELIAKHRQLAQSSGKHAYLPLAPWRERQDKNQVDTYIRNFLLEIVPKWSEDYTMTSHQEAFFSSSDFNPEEVNDILERIDQNLATRMAARAPDPQTAPSTLPVLPDTSALDHHFREVKRSTAPLFTVTGRSPKQLLRRVLNMPIKVFGYKQRHFNGELIHLLEHMVAQIYSLRGAFGQIKDLHEQIRSLSAQVHMAISESQDVRRYADRLVGDLRSFLENVGAEQRGQREWLEQVGAEQRGQREWLEQVAAEQRGQREWLEQVAAEQRGQREWLEQVVAEQRGQREWLEQVAAEQRGHSDWVSILQRKQQMLALDVRELVSSRHADHDFPEPRIVDPERYQQRLIAMGETIKVNLGCGEKPLPDYINVDFRELMDVDIVADARRLPFADESLAEIASFHLVEHFRKYHLSNVVLPYWYRLLRRGGIVRIVCPNWSAMIERLNDGRMSLEEFRLLTFGAQDYEGDDHFAMYTPETLSEILRTVGFVDIEILALDRMNGICPEMEIVARRP